jgi:transcriptional regulator with XRE-family HTH domain
MLDLGVKHLIRGCGYIAPMETMGDRIRYLRGTKGMSQSDLAERCGVTKAAVSAWELGNAANIKLQTFLKLCDTLGCVPEFLIYGPSRKPPDGDSSAQSGIYRKPTFRKN